jgi:hypothetical protein
LLIKFFVARDKKKKRKNNNKNKVKKKKKKKRISMESTEDSPSLLNWIGIRAAELFPKEKTEREDANLQIPFNECKLTFYQYTHEKHFLFIFTNFIVIIKSCALSLPLLLLLLLYFDSTWRKYKIHRKV